MFVAVSSGSHFHIFDRSGVVVETLKSFLVLRVAASVRERGLSC